MTRLVRSCAVRLAIAAGLTGYLLWISHPDQIGRATAGAAPSWLFFACALVLVDRTLMAWRWIALLRPLTVSAPPPTPPPPGKGTAEVVGGARTVTARARGGRGGTK